MSLSIQQGLFQYDLIDHYAVLGVPLDASGQEIRQRYLKIAYYLHPDTCKAESDAQKQKASQLLSKLVNPAYEKLSREKSRTEYLLVLAQLGQSLASEKDRKIAESEIFGKLARAKSNINLTYHNLLQPLASDQYDKLDRIDRIIGQISELNLAYLMLEGASGKSVRPKSIPSERGGRSEGQPKERQAEPVSPAANSLRRAQNYFNANNFPQVILELREALKVEPNNSTCHALLGLTYLRQKQLTMAKVHINKAWASNPKDPLSVRAKQELDRQVPPEKQSQPPSGRLGGGLFGGLFGKKKS